MNNVYLDIVIFYKSSLYQDFFMPFFFGGLFGVVCRKIYGLVF